MENQHQKQGAHSANGEVEVEEISESFLCCVCLDILYKPVVLSCGHVSCFWCVYRSMGLYESHCPICRHTYNCFPSICLLLHRLLPKIYPIAYKIRGKLILEEEKKIQFFSPELDSSGTGSPLDENIHHQADSQHPSSSTEGNCDSMEQSGSVISILSNDITICEEKCHEMPAEETNLLDEKLTGFCKQFSIANLLCTGCKQLLIRPVALNCGHVYCESCIISPAEEQLRCQDCQSLHPAGFPKVCLVLDHFIREQFSEEYALRKDAAQLKENQLKHKKKATCFTKAEKQSTGEHPSWFADPRAKVHIGFGCDSCGVCPIIGDRYRCKDCLEAASFDLCGACYNNPSKILGRFNQRHTPEHRMELQRTNIRPHIMLQLMTRRLESGSTPLVLADDVAESPENIPSINPPDNNQSNSTNDSILTVTMESSNATGQNNSEQAS